MSDCQAGDQQFKSWHPTSYVGKTTAAMLVLYTGKGVAPEVNLREHICHIYLCQVQIRLPTLDLKPRGDINRSPSQWPHKWTCAKQKKGSNLSDRNVQESAIKTP